ncbi:SAM-dependent methyltransferase [Actinobacillus equuli subsp. equuli]|nr:N-6 DNA methylase [Actinobacillus equuli]WGE44752.1 SAM-dependent methyltransferase [Actinobacillus equuli subsp. equuli]
MKFKNNQTEQKLRGGYYTPRYLSDYITKWILNGSPLNILEPSCGDGVFIKSLASNKYNKINKITCFELIDSEADKTIKLLEEMGFNNSIVNKGDFLGWALKSIGNTEFDAIIGNPPFIRYQYLDEKFQSNSKAIFDKLNLKFTKHTNSWVPFLLSSLSLLKDKGRIGMVIPSEILNVIHAQPLRDFIANGLYRVLIINPKNIWFDNTLQGAIIIFIEKVEYKNQSGLSIVNVENDEFINIEPENLFKNANYISFENFQGKWTNAILDEKELDLINKIKAHNSVYKFSDIATVEVGIVTGTNEFFLVDDNTVKEYDLYKFSYPMFGKSQHCKGIIYDHNQHIENKENNFPTNFIYLGDEYVDLPLKAQEYIKEGEKEVSIKDINARLEHHGIKSLLYIRARSEC